jgi:hypothetical protein
MPYHGAGSLAGNVGMMDSPGPAPQMSAWVKSALWNFSVVAGWTKMDATRNYYAAPVTSISVALPSGMKSFPVEGQASERPRHSS